MIGSLEPRHPLDNQETCREDKATDPLSAGSGHSHVLRLLNCGAGGTRTHTVRHLKPVPPGQLGYGPFLLASLPANVGVCEWQFGQRKRRFSSGCPASPVDVIHVQYYRLAVPLGRDATRLAGVRHATLAQCPGQDARLRPWCARRACNQDVLRGEPPCTRLSSVRSYSLEVLRVDAKLLEPAADVGVGPAREWNL